MVCAEANFLPGKRDTWRMATRTGAKYMLVGLNSGWGTRLLCSSLQTKRRLLGQTKSLGATGWNDLRANVDRYFLGLHPARAETFWETLAMRRDPEIPLFSIMVTQSWNDTCPRSKITSNLISCPKWRSMLFKWRKNLWNLRNSSVGKDLALHALVPELDP